MMEEKKLLTVRELAEYLGLSEITIYRKVKAGEIPAKKIGGSWRFPKDLIDEWLKKETSKPPSIEEKPSVLPYRWGETPVITEERVFGSLRTLLNYDEKRNTWGIIFSGSMDTIPAEDITRIIKLKCFDRKYNYVILINTLRYISSRGLALLTLFEKKKENFAYFSMPNRHIKKTIELLGINELLERFENLDELYTQNLISKDLYNVLKEQQEILLRKIPDDKWWLRILADLVEEDEIFSAIRKISPFIREAKIAQTLTLPAEESFTPAFFKFLEKVFYEEAKVPEEEIDRGVLEFIAKEIMANVITYAYEGRKEGIVEVSFTKEDNTLSLNIIDYGVGLSKETAFSKKGGLYYLKKIFDEIEIKPAPEKPHPGITLGKGTHLILRKKLHDK